MACFSLFFSITLLMLYAHLPLIHSSSCRCLASDLRCWPATQAWQIFNATIDCRLINVQPPAAPCHSPGQDQQDACNIAREKWNNPFWRADHPGAMQASNWEMAGDKRCLITSNHSSTACSQGSVPVYAVNASNPSHVQSAVRFASKHNLRLAVKSTGHSYLGSSTAPESLSIWLHHMNNMTFHNKFSPDCCRLDAESPAVTVAAGVQWEEVYLAASRRNYVIAGGACSSVGAAGGYPQAGGHSALSPLLGLAADNILQYEVVTADGQLVTANSCNNPELFWALRGGGGGTFGVVVSATHKLHPPLTGLVFTLYNFTATDSSSFESLIDRFLNIHPALSDAGWSGYFRLSGKSLIVNYLLPNRDVSFANETFAPLMAYVQEQPESLQFSGSMLDFPSYEAWRLQIQCGGQPSCFNVTGLNSSGSTKLGQAVVLASRLLPRTTLATSSASVSSALVKLSEEYRVSGNFVAGGQVTQPQNNAVNPAWRRALVHLILGSGWPENATVAEQDMVAAALTQANKLVRDLTPDSGTYMNEADFNEPDWQQSFFGEHYPRLYSIKQKVDPAGLFVCRHCVGSEDWTRDLNCRIKQAIL